MIFMEVELQLDMAGFYTIQLKPSSSLTIKLSGVALIVRALHDGFCTVLKILQMQLVREIEHVQGGVSRQRVRNADDPALLFAVVG